MSDITDFFSGDRKAKVNNLPKKEVVQTRVEPELVEEPSLKAKSEVLKEELVSKIETSSKETKRYRAVPKERNYLEKRSDLFSLKRIQVNDDDYRFLSDIERSISVARRHLDPAERVNYRITSNTIIRLAIEEFVEKAKLSIEDDDSICNSLQSDEQIRKWIKSL